MRIYIKVSPKSSKNEVVKVSEGEYKVKITAPPVDGKANEALIKLLSQHFKVSKSMISIVGGKTAKIKMVDIG
ncbi:MAG TPA: YggU family protein [Candidatus Moranbacteria bacterium]|nr:YggU family protein [Candidatus Moranbacteria bacterium]HBT45369.1 YggU family protein [Candidatus Moranbacteria bacterium]